VTQDTQLKTEERRSAQSTRSGRTIPSLDGLRALAISFVVVAHAALQPAHPNNHVVVYLSVLAQTGVRIFFVLSGFLITSLILKELRATGRVSLRRFYIRRTLRIFPAMYAFLTVVAIAYLTGIVRIGNESPFRIFAAVAYVSDYIPIVGWPLHHTWSLSVEEQFYLGWPAILAACGPRRATPILALLLLIAPVSRALFFSEFRFDTVADSLAIGCLVGIYRDRFEAVVRRWTRKIPTAFILAIPLVTLPMANPYNRYQLLASLIGISFQNAAIGLAMLAVIIHPPFWLNNRPVVWLGRISYSLYLWHVPWVQDLRIGWLWLPASVLSAWLSYRYVEQPILGWRDQGSSLPHT
jgi:peptidoglycan/LPS O-acetylase OafA/YrhL